MYFEIENVIGKRMALLEAIISEAKNNMPRDVAGRLRVCYTGRYPKYYQIKDPKDRQGKYIRKGDMGLIRELAQKTYNEDMIILAEEELRFLQKLSKTYPEKTIDNYWDNLPDARRDVIDPIWPSDEDYIKRWLSREYKSKGFDPNDHSQFITNSGLRVRSKTEVNIANRLEAYNVPFIYEFPHYLDGYGLIYPDFSILHVRTRTTIIWEHYGMLDDKEYRENNFLRKNTLYAGNGFFSGKNLIQTFESLKTPLSIPLIDTMIKEYLL